MYLTQSLHRALQREPSRVATIFGDRVRTVAESVDRIARIGGALLRLGVQPGDRVAFLGLNSDRYHEYLFAVPWIGAVVNPVNIRWSPAEIAYSRVQGAAQRRVRRHAADIRRGQDPQAGTAQAILGRCIQWSPLIDDSD